MNFTAHKNKWGLTHFVSLLKHKNFLLPVWVLLLLTGLYGCGGTIKKAEYPNSWSPRITSSTRADCLDISGAYKLSNGLPLLPFFLFGIVDTDSLDWANLVEIYERLLAEPDGSTVTIESLDSDHLEVVVAMDEIPIAKQELTRSHQSENAAKWFGQNHQSFRCVPNGIVINSAYIHSWVLYNLPYEEKKRRYRSTYSVVGPLGISAGYFYFSKTIDGSLVMLERLYGCSPCNSLDESWRRWDPVLSPTTK